VTDRGGPQPTLEFLDQLEITLAVFEGRDRREEISRIGQSVGTDGPQIGQAQRRAEIFADIAANTRPGLIAQVDAKTDAARNDRDLLWLEADQAELGAQRDDDGIQPSVASA
jgi:hypothetical protein